ncbi:MAG TPA: hypothetical protein P5081_06250 [Phycisphaerae bacterium]|nr:hypothetical protein [Phycisphaerae bacterium]HRW52470.1 hypothetical protein [Phycisphaerae bacterium]
MTESGPAAAGTPNGPAPLGAITLLGFLVGRRDAILAIASDRRWLWTGLMFTLAAGMAREYDAEYLPARPYVVFIPIAASLVASFLLYCVSFGFFFNRRESAQRFWPGYRSFLSLFWATAPLALLYAIPFERFLGEYDAALANMRTLGLVAVWRVILFVRVVSILGGVSFLRALWPVMLFGDLTVLAALILTPQPIVHFMGGVRLSPTISLISMTNSILAAWTILLAPVWIIGSIVVHLTRKRVIFLEPYPLRRKARPPWVLAGASLAMWIVIAPAAQREQRLGHDADALLATNRIDEALAMMSAHTLAEFPPNYDPRPRVYYGDSTPEVMPVMRAIVAHPPAEWVRRKYADKFEFDIMSRYREYPPLDDVLAILRELPEGPEIAQRLLAPPWTTYQESDNDTPARTALLAELQAMADRAGTP